MSEIHLPERDAHGAALRPPGTGLDREALLAWLAPRLSGVGAGLAVERIDGGQSNPSWILRGTDQAWVLRAKPGPAASLLPSAHAIEREFQVLRALQGGAVPVPPVRLLCEDESVIGAAFYVMDFVQGRILRDATLPGVPRHERAAYHAEAGRVLAALHALDWQACGLQDFGRREGFYSRLIRRWTQQYRASGGGLQAMEQLAAWLPGHIPPGADEGHDTCLTHGDFRMENLMFHPQRPEVVAVLDWELSTLGHPLNDLAYNCLAWHMPSGVLRGYGDQDVAALGLPGEAAYVRRYCELTGRNLGEVQAHWPFHVACNLFRLAAILQGIARREQQGLASSASAAEIGRMAGPVAELGWAVAQGRRAVMAD